MNTLKFDYLMEKFGARLGQHPMEWRIFLEFIYSYFKDRHIENPIVIEIGTMHNVQKEFYKELLGAEHIGIDITGNADIVGRSQALITRKNLEVLLAGRKIDLLFIDGDHLYDAVKSDYEIYGPLTRHIIALHDISHPYSPAIPEETMRFWNEIIMGDKENTHLSIQHYNSVTTGLSAGRQMGIGLVVKG